jgi:hypothetical protein
MVVGGRQSSNRWVLTYPYFPLQGGAVIFSFFGLSRKYFVMKSLAAFAKSTSYTGHLAILFTLWVTSSRMLYVQFDQSGVKNEYLSCLEPPVGLLQGALLMGYAKVPPTGTHARLFRG